MYANIKITATFALNCLSWQWLSQVFLEAYTTHSVEGHSVRDSAPHTGLSVFALPLSSCQCPSLMNGHLMIWEGHSIEWKMCRSVASFLLALSLFLCSTCRWKQRLRLCIHAHSGEERSGFTYWLERRLNTHTHTRHAWPRKLFTHFSRDVLRHFEGRWLIL